MVELNAGMPDYVVAAVFAGLLVCMALLMVSARYAGDTAHAGDEEL